jgi:ABC-type lipoprotein release transport system permease subunit
VHPERLMKSGLAAALAAARVLRSLLFEVHPSNPCTFVAILSVLVLAVLAVSWISAHRAATIHPSEALREG